MRRWFVNLCVLVLTVVGGVVRAIPAVRQPFWYDEIDTWRAAAGRAGVHYIDFLTWRHHFEHAPLGFLLPRVAMDLFHSEAPWVLRLPSLLCGIACIPVGWWVGRVILSDALGILIALLIAFDPNMVDQSAQCRMYTMLALFMLIAIGHGVRLLRGEQTVARWVVLSLTLAALLWTTQLGTFVWVGLALAAIITLAVSRLHRLPNPKPVPTLAGFIVAFLIAAGLCFIPIRRIFDRMLHNPGRGADVRPPQIAHEIAAALKDLIHLPPHGSTATLTLVAAIYFAIAAVGLVLLARRGPRERVAAVVIASLAVANVVMIFPFRKQHHFMDPRYLAAVQPALWVGLGMAVVGWWRSPAAVATQLDEPDGADANAQGELPDSSAAPPAPAPNSRLALLGRITVLLVVVYLLAQARQSVHIHWWQSDPDRYDIMTAIQYVQTNRDPSEAIVYHPKVLDEMGEYAGLLADVDFERSLYRGGNELAADAHYPNTYKPPSTWLIIGMVNDQRRADSAREALRILARGHDFKLYADDPLLAWIKPHRVVIAHVNAQGVTLHDATGEVMGGRTPTTQPATTRPE